VCILFLFWWFNSKSEHLHCQWNLLVVDIRLFPTSCSSGNLPAYKVCLYLLLLSFAWTSCLSYFLRLHGYITWLRWSSIRTSWGLPLIIYIPRRRACTFLFFIPSFSMKSGWMFFLWHTVCPALLRSCWRRVFYIFCCCHVGCFMCLWSDCQLIISPFSISLEYRQPDHVPVRLLLHFMFIAYSSFISFSTASTIFLCNLLEPSLVKLSQWSWVNVSFSIYKVTRNSP